MTRSFKTNFALSATLHLVALVVLAFAMAFTPPPPEPQPTWMDLAPGLGEPSPSPAPVPGPIAPPQPPELPPQATLPVEPTPPVVQPPDPIPDPVPLVVPPTPPRPEPSEVAQNDDILPTQPPAPRVEQPRPKPPQPRVETPKPPKKNTVKPPSDTRPRVQVSTTRVSRTRGPAPSSSTPPRPATGNASTAGSYNASGFQKTLLNKLGGGVGISGTSATGVKSEFGWYDNQIKQLMEEAWKFPFGLDPGLSAGIQIRIEKNGVISRVALARSSGNSTLDEAAVAAATGVKKVPPVPDGLSSGAIERTLSYTKRKS